MERVVLKNRVQIFVEDLCVPAALEWDYMFIFNLPCLHFPGPNARVQSTYPWSRVGTHEGTGYCSDLRIDFNNPSTNVGADGIHEVMVNLKKRIKKTSICFN